MSREAPRGAVLKLGFEDVDAALVGLERLGTAAEALTPLLGETADPDLALRGLLELVAATDDPVLATLVDDEESARRLLAVLGASSALAEHLVRHPDQWRELIDPTLAEGAPTAQQVRATLLEAVGADPGSATPTATEPDAEAVNTLRVQYRRLLVRLAARDLAHGLPLAEVAGELADLAAATLETALAIARQRVGEAAQTARLSVLAMGKCGGGELNYVSDVDVIFVHEPAPGAADGPALRAATQLASHLIRICSDHTSEGTIWPVDAGLRPEGGSGPLTRTLASHRAYYERWAKTWEFQALLKARPVAGDLELGEEFVELVAPMVWSAAAREGFVPDVQAMRRRVLDHIPAHEATRQLKLGSGGLRDVEFAVQLLQLVHGKADPEVRARSTLAALRELTAQGYVGREDGDSMHAAYEFLRTLEHRIQLYQMRRTHVVPEAEADLRRLGRSLGYLRDPVAELDKAWAFHRREVRRLHEKLFYRPLLNAVARISGAEQRLSTDAARDRLAALGYQDPAAALRHLEALSAGVKRSASIQRALLPAMLGWFADAPDPDAGLLGFRRISETLGDTPWYLRSLRDEGEVAQRFATVLATSRYATDLLEREPQGVKLLAEDLTPLTAEAIGGEMIALASRQTEVAVAVRSLRAVRRRELLRIAVGDLLGHTDVEEVGAALGRLTDATLEATLHAVMASVASAQGLAEAPTRMAIVAMGRYGGFELSYASDADVMFVHDPVPGADPRLAANFAQTVANDVRAQLAAPGPDPALDVDAGLRPEGKQGPLVRTVESYAAYYAKWSMVWEGQALLRADAVVGDAELRERFTALIDPIRYPAAGLSGNDVIEVRRIKARVDTERLPRGADPKTHLKLGRGGLTDIEWTVQLLQMQHAGAVPALRTPRTLEALTAAGEADLISADDVEKLAESWRLVSRIRNAITLIRGKPADQLPRDATETAAIASLLGYAPGQSDDFVNDYLRTTRRAHSVVDRVFWG